jgi:hypothetical protein
MLTSGLVLVRMYMGKYTALNGIFTTREPHQVAMLGDDALTIALPMLVVAFVTLLVSHSLFPDETDFRVLLALPISKRAVFFSKLLALLLFAGLFVIAAHIAMAPLIVTMSIGRWAAHGVLHRLAAYGVASVGASLFVILALMAINGLLLLCVPRMRLQAAALVARSALLFALAVCVPLAAKLPTLGPFIASETWLSYLVPPIWFLGAERVLLDSGTPYFVQLARIAVAAIVAVLLIAMGSYAFLYRRFDRVILRPADAASGRRQRRARLLHRPVDRRQAFAAISHFTRATLTRSPLHHGVFVAVTAFGTAIGANRFLDATGATAVPSTTDALTSAAIWAPFALVFMMNLAVRTTLVLPFEPRANWIFRMTEDDSRGEQLSAAVQTVVWLGVIVPLLTLFPVEWAVLGPRAIECTSIALLCGLVLAELHMGEWRRIPFTCSYAPGKRFVGNTIIIGFAAFLVFTTIGYGLVRYSIERPTAWLIVIGVLGAVALQRRRARLWLWQRTTLVFEDIVPNEIEPLRLSAD